MSRSFLALALCTLTFACVGTTGSDYLEFKAYAAGPKTATEASPYSFQSDLGFAVTLTRARLHVGAAYLDSSMPTLGAQATSCTLPGLYVASVPGPVDIDVLSGAPQPFSVQGGGTSIRALAGELWLTGGPIDADVDTTVILDVAGNASKEGTSFPFEGKVTIGENRAIPASNPALPGSNPICKQRIVSPIPVDLTPRAGGSLLVRINPAGWFSNVNFSKLAASTTESGLRVFADDNSDQPSRNLFYGLTQASVQTYTFDWVDPADL